MKTKFFLLIGAVALVTLSFTVVEVKEQRSDRVSVESSSTKKLEPVGGLYADIVE